MKIQWTLLELGYGPTFLADEMMMMVIGQLVARAVAEVEPADEPELREEIQRPVYRHHPDLGTAGPYLLHALMLLHCNGLQ